MRDRDPVPVGRVLGEMVEARGWRDRLAIGRLRAAWPRVVGEQIAAHSKPYRLDGGVLSIRADAGPWAAELALLASRLAAQADAFLGGGLVTEARVSAGSRP